MKEIMYHTYYLGTDEEGKIYREHFSEDISYYIIYDSQEECDEYEKQLAEQEIIHQKERQHYIDYLQSCEKGKRNES